MKKTVVEQFVKYILGVFLAFMSVGCRQGNNYYAERCGLYINVRFLEDGNTRIFIGRDPKDMSDSFIIKGPRIESESFRLFLEKQDSKDIYILDPKKQISNFESSNFRFHVTEEYMTAYNGKTVWVDSAMISEENIVLRHADWWYGFYVCMGDSVVGRTVRLK